MPETSLEHELRVAAATPTFVTTVNRVVDLAPRLREITLVGGLEDFGSLGLPVRRSSRAVGTSAVLSP